MAFFLVVDRFGHSRVALYWSVQSLTIIPLGTSRMHCQDGSVDKSSCLLSWQSEFGPLDSQWWKKRTGSAACPLTSTSTSCHKCVILCRHMYTHTHTHKYINENLKIFKTISRTTYDNITTQFSTKRLNFLSSLLTVAIVDISAFYFSSLLTFS